MAHHTQCSELVPLQGKSWGPERRSSVSAVTKLEREPSGLELTCHTEKGSSALLGARLCAKHSGHHIQVSTHRSLHVRWHQSPHFPDHATKPERSRSLVHDHTGDQLACPGCLTSKACSVASLYHQTLALGQGLEHLGLAVPCLAQCSSPPTP